MRLTALLLTMILCGCTVLTSVNSQDNSGKEFYQKAEHLIQDRQYNEACQFYKQAAEKQYAPAYRRLASIYYMGLLGTYDYYAAAKWLKLSAEQGDEGAAGRLGLHYYQGKGVEKDERKGMLLLQEAAQQGDAFSQHFLWVVRFGHLNKDTRDNELELLKSSAEQGNVEALESLAEYKKFIGSFDEAFDLYYQAAIQNRHSAQKELAECYLTGQGTVQDIVEAAAWACISNNWTGDEIPMELPPAQRMQISKRISELKNEIERYRIDNWKKVTSVHY